MFERRGCHQFGLNAATAKRDLIPIIQWDKGLRKDSKKRKKEEKNSRRIAGHKDKTGRKHPDADTVGLKLVWKIL